MTLRLRYQLIPQTNLQLIALHRALLSWAAARALDADLVLTVVDRDQAAVSSVDESMDALNWLGIDWDEGPYADGELGSTRQSERTARYEAVQRRLSEIDDNLALEVVEENGRFSPAFTTLVDDVDFAISHVVTYARAVDPLTARLIETLGWNLPTLLYIHEPLAPDGALLSGQQHARLTQQALQDSGYLPSAIFHYLLQLSWPAAAEMAMLDRWLVRKHFSLEQLATAPARFDWPQLRAVNRRYLQALSGERLSEAIRPFLEDAYGPLPTAAGWLARVTEIIKPDLETLEDAIDAAEWALSEEIALDESARLAVADPEVRAVLMQLIAEVAAVVLLDAQTARTILEGVRKRTGVEEGILNTAVCSALTGRTGLTSDPAPLMSILGKQITLKRLGAILR